jgi:hypothetical protein
MAARLVLLPNMGKVSRLWAQPCLAPLTLSSMLDSNFPRLPKLSVRSTAQEGMHVCGMAPEHSLLARARNLTRSVNWQVQGMAHHTIGICQQASASSSLPCACCLCAAEQEAERGCQQRVLHSYHSGWTCRASRLLLA